jgi:glycosyltransferase involved in cell wall biosynthesis
MLADELPLAKFLILVRDPRDFIRSGLRRNYYQGHDWDVGRLQPEEHSPDYTQWKGMEPFAKISWLWAQTYTHIQKTVEAICDSRMLLVRFEDLVSSTEKAKEIFDFLELTGFSPQQIEKILALKLNEQKGPGFPKSKDWPEAWNQTLRRECSALAKSYGYDLGQAKPVTVADGDASTQTAYHVRPVNRVPKVGVGLPVYSGGDLLEGAIAAILDQDLKDLELVVLDLGRDPRTREICNNFQKKDSRLRYMNSGQDRDYLGMDSIVRVLNLTNSRYFMWASYDDRHHPSFLRKAVERLDEDPKIALVYFLTQLADAEGRPISSLPDRVNAEMEDPLERFDHVIRNLDLCNAFYGLFRRETLMKCKALRQYLYRAYDNLLLAEIALYGKIIQLGEILFTRRMTRPRGQSLEDNNADVIRSHDPSALDDGITFPLCRLVYAHCELIAYYAASREQRNRLVQQTVTCFRKRFESRLRGEIQRALDLISQDVIYRTWDGREEEPKDAPGSDPVERLQLNSLVARMQEACFLYPDWPELSQTYQECQLRTANWPSLSTCPHRQKGKINR